MSIGTLWFLIWLWPCALFAASPAEQNISRELKNRLDPAWIVELQAGNERFLAIHRKNTLPTPRGAVILLHDQKRNADWPEVISPLRKGLSKRGWDTLSIQLPLSSGTFVRPQANRNEESRPRISAAIQYLLGLEHEKILLLGHGTGAASATSFAAVNPQKELIALVAINFANARQESSDIISQVKIPMLDIYGKQDQGRAEHRKQQALAGENEGFSQFYVGAADHDFTGLQDDLLSRVHGWMSRVAKNR